MLRSTKLLIVLAVIVGTMVAGQSMATIWDAAADFSSVNNPNGQWSYGWGSVVPHNNYVGYTFTAYTLKQTTMIAGWGNAGPMLFAQTNAQNAPNLIKNITGTLQDVGGAGTVLPYGLFAFPGTLGNGSIVRWTAVDAGTYDISSVFEFGHGPLAYYGWGAVIMNGTTVLQDSAISTTTPLSYTGSATLSAGGTIDFILTSPGVTYYHNGTRISAVVATQDAPLKVRVSGAVSLPGGGLASGATVEVVGGTESAITESGGYYSFDVAPGTYTLRASKTGWGSHTVSGVVVDGTPVTQDFLLTVSQGAAGWVHAPNGANIVGASVTVDGRTEHTTTDSNGNYVLPIPDTGTFTLRVTKPGYETTIQSDIVIGADTIVPVNITMANGGAFSGRVLAKPSPGTGVAGVTLTSSDGVYTIVSGTDGSFSGNLTSGTYKFRAYKYGYLAETYGDFTINTSGASHNFLLTQGWDLGGDFNTAANPGGGAWSYAFDNATNTTFNYMSFYANWPAGGNCYRTGLSIPGVYVGSLAHNPTWATMPKTGTMRAVIEPWSVVTHAGRGYDVGGDYGIRTIARFIAPVSGYYDVDLTLTGRTDHDTAATYDNDGPGPQPTGTSVDGTTSQVAFLRNSAPVAGFPQQLNGYVGTPSVGYTDSFGTNPKITYHNVGLVNAGEVFDVVVSGDNSGWTGVDFTVAAKSASCITGIVTSDRPGNPPVVEALVTAGGGGPSFTALTDATGRYRLMLPAGEYQIDVSRPGHEDTGNGHATVTVDADSTASQDFSLHFKNEWDAKADFSMAYNPNGEWSYGYVAGTVDTNRHLTFTPYTKFGEVLFSGFNGWTTPDYIWGGFGVNKTGAPLTASYGGNPWWYVEDDQMWQSPGGTLMGQPNIPSRLSVLRWTAPKDMVVNVNATWKSQYVPGHLVSGGYYYAMFPTVTKNGAIVTAPQLDGFVGRAINGYTDSVAPILGGLSPQESFNTAVRVVAGDKLDFSFQWNTLGWPVYGLDVHMTEGSGQTVTSIAQIKALADGTTVFMTTPLQLGTGTGASQPGAFGYRYGSPTVAERYFFVQTDDRLQSLRLVAAGGLPDVSVNHKITFTGTVATDAFGRKIVNVGSIDSSVESTAPVTLGKAGKSLTSNGVLTRAWGKITSLTLSSDPNYTYEYITINDGSQDIKVMMHVQGPWLNIGGDAWVGYLSRGDYIGVTGIAYTSTPGGTDVVIMPRSSWDYDIYLDVPAVP